MGETMKNFNEMSIKEKEVFIKTYDCRTNADLEKALDQR